MDLQEFLLYLHDQLQLVEKGADVKYKKRGISALDYALSTGEIQDAKTQIELIEYLDFR